MEPTNDLLPIVSDANERFRTIRELGSGTYGRVMLALDRDLQQRCALKILQKNLLYSKTPNLHLNLTKILLTKLLIFRRKRLNLHNQTN